MAQPRKAKVKEQDTVKEESQIKFVNVYEVKEEVTVKEEVDGDCGGEGDVAKTTSSTFIGRAQPSTSKEMTDKRMEIEHTIHAKMKLTPSRRLLPPPPKFDELTSSSSMKEIEWQFAQNQYDSLTLQPPVAAEAPANLLQSHIECNNISEDSIASSSKTVLQLSADASPYTATGRAFASELETPVKGINRKKLSIRERYFRNIQDKEEREHLERMRYIRWKREILREKREALKEKQEALRREREAVREWAAVAKETEKVMHKILAVTEEPNQTSNVPSIVEETKLALQKVSETVVIAAKAFKAIHALFMIESNCDIVI